MALEHQLLHLCAKQEEKERGRTRRMPPNGIQGLHLKSHRDFVDFQWSSLVAREPKVCVIWAGHVATQNTLNRQQPGSALSSIGGYLWSLGGKNMALEPRHNCIWILALLLFSCVTMGNSFWCSGSVLLAVKVKRLILCDGAVLRSRGDSSGRVLSAVSDI